MLLEIRSVLEKHPKVETKTVRVRLTELAAASIYYVELVCYVLTRDFNEFAEVRESLLLHIMSFVEDSGTNLASPSQTLYLSGDPASKPPANSKSESAAKQITDSIDDKRLAEEAATENSPSFRTLQFSLWSTTRAAGASDNTRQLEPQSGRSARTRLPERRAVRESANHEPSSHHTAAARNN